MRDCGTDAAEPWVFQKLCSAAFGCAAFHAGSFHAPDPDPAVSHKTLFCSTGNTAEE